MKKIILSGLLISSIGVSGLFAATDSKDTVGTSKLQEVIDTHDTIIVKLINSKAEKSSLESYTESLETKIKSLDVKYNNQFKLLEKKHLEEIKELKMIIASKQNKEVKQEVFSSKNKEKFQQYLNENK